MLYTQCLDIEPPGVPAEVSITPTYLTNKVRPMLEWSNYCIHLINEGIDRWLCIVPQAAVFFLNLVDLVVRVEPNDSFMAFFY
jgi:hypothetical protein